MIWERSENAYYAVVTGLDDKVRFRMIVESTDDGWDWSTWYPAAEPRIAPSYGVAATVQDAMREAEGATQN